MLTSSLQNNTLIIKFLHRVYYITMIWTDVDVNCNLTGDGGIQQVVVEQIILVYSSSSSKVQLFLGTIVAFELLIDKIL